MSSISGSYTPSPDMDSIFAYMDELEKGFSPDEIDQQVLDPMIEKSDALFAEEVENLQAILKNRQEIKEQIGEERFFQAESLDITEAARNRVNELRASFQNLEKTKETLSKTLESAKQDLETAHETSERLTTHFQRMTATLKNTPVESRWTQLITQGGRGVSQAIAGDANIEQAPVGAKKGAREEIFRLMTKDLNRGNT